LLLGFVGLAWSTPPLQVISSTKISKIQAKYGVLAARRLGAWQNLVNTGYKKPETLKLRLVNDFFNEAKFVSDQENWHKKDYWATPVELLIKDAGDCEDYVIAKYITLKAMGVDNDKLYLSYVKSIRLRQAHMVLTYFKKPNTIPLVLDNINSRILKATKRKDLIPIYSFNGDGLWLAKQRGKSKAIKGGAQAIKQWQKLLKKLKDKNHELN
jgi:predicted transglutaminase-like cysteine proteinase